MSQLADDHAHAAGTAGVQADVAALYGRFYETMFDAALSVLSPNGLAGEAEAAVHAVAYNLVRMHKQGTLTPRQDWAAYLWKAARNQALKIVKDRHKTEPLDRQHDEEDDTDERPGAHVNWDDPVGAEVTQREQADQLWDAMDRLQLSQRSRRILTGYYLFELTDAQLGEELGISGRRVGVIRHSVQDKLAVLLRGGDHE